MIGDSFWQIIEGSSTVHFAGHNGFFIFAAVLLVVFVFRGLIGAAYGRIGFSARAIALLLIAVLVGSFINVPLFTLESRARIVQDTYVSIFEMTYRVPATADSSKKRSLQLTLVARSFRQLSHFISCGDFRISPALRSSGDACGDRFPPDRFPPDFETSSGSWDRFPCTSVPARCCHLYCSRSDTGSNNRKRLRRSLHKWGARHSHRGRFNEFGSNQKNRSASCFNWGRRNIRRGLPFLA